MNDDDDNFSDDDDDYEYEYNSDCAASATSATEPTDSFGDSISDNSGAPHPKSGSRSASASTRNMHEFPSLKAAAAVSMWQTQHVRDVLQSLVAEASSALGVSPAAAMPLLRQFEWNLQSLLQCYFANAESTLQRAGVQARCLLQSAYTTTADVGTPAEDQTCLICMDEIGRDEGLSMGCGHDFCRDCWGDYLTNAIQHEGATCMDATCPQAECTEVITEVEVQAAAPQCLAKFQDYQLRAFVELNPQLRWCPGKGCDRIAYYNGATASNAQKQQHSTSISASCDDCHAAFCFTCGDEAHIPATCHQIKLWKEKNSNGDSETANWMTVNTKPCPNCGHRIEKNGGCMYMACAKCKHRFCWMCMGTHHVWSCNAYKESDKQGNEVDEKIRAKIALERYLHYYQRYDGHEKAQAFAQKQLDKCREQELSENDMAIEDDKIVSSTQGLVDVPLLIEANQQIVNCRQVLKSSYVFAFYYFSPNNKTKSDNGGKMETTSTDKIQKECFEQHQGILEGMTEQLSKVTEMPKDQMDRQDVVNRTRAIQQFIKNVCEYVEEGMA